MFIEQTNALNEYLFGKKEIKSEKNIFIKAQEEEIEKDIINILNVGKDLCYRENSIYSLYSKDKHYEKKFIYYTSNESQNKNLKNENIFDILMQLNLFLIDKVGNCNIFISKIKENIKKENNVVEGKNEKDSNNIKDIEENKLIDNNLNNKSLIDSNKNQGSNEKSDNKLDHESNEPILYFGKKLDVNNNTLTNSLSNFNKTDNTRNITDFTSKISNSNFKDNISLENEEEEDEEEEEEEKEEVVDEEEEEEAEGDEEFVYISRTGSKYHGNPECGRMKISTMVSRKKAESLGLEPCMRCYY